MSPEGKLPEISPGNPGILIYRTEDGRSSIHVRLENRTVWLSQKLMAELFDVTVPTVNEHIKNIYEEEELHPDATIRRFRTVRKEGPRTVRRKVDFYNLDAIISVGNRVRSHSVTQFREWAMRQPALKRDVEIANVAGTEIESTEIEENHTTNHSFEHSLELIDRVSRIIEKSKNLIVSSINMTMVRTYWQIGKEIVEDEQQGKSRAEYGKYLIRTLSGELRKRYGKGFNARNLRSMRQFYIVYPIWNAVRSELSWTHFRLLMRIDDHNKRSFYEIECVKNNWSTRELDRQINSLLFERLALSKDKVGLMELAMEGQIIATPDDIVKDPYVLEFLGMDQQDKLYEKDLESALIDHLQQFLLELGRGFSFVARQKYVRMNDEHFYIDLVFYNYLLRCFVLIDLKVGKLTHQDLGQMQMYVNYYRRERANPGDTAPIGIVLCADKSEAVVKYTLPEDNKQIFASKYKLYLPTEEELKAEILKERDLLRLRSALGSGDDSP